MMASVPVNQASTVEAVEERFRRLKDKWVEETSHLSSSTAIVSHPSFREIVAMGKSVVALMLRDLNVQPGLWVWALAEITGADPVPPEDVGRISRMSQAWLRGGRERGYEC